MTGIPAGSDLPDRPGLPGLSADLIELRRDPGSSGIFADFDGTLSEIVDEPSAAVAVPGVLAVLDALAGRYRQVGLLSGRPVAFLESRMSVPTASPGCRLGWRWPASTGSRPSSTASGRTTRSVASGERRSTTSRPARRLGDQRACGSRSKGLSLTLHYHGRPEREADVRQSAKDQATRSGLHPAPGPDVVRGCTHRSMWTRERPCSTWWPPRSTAGACPTCGRSASSATTWGDPAGLRRPGPGWGRWASTTVRIGVRSPGGPPRSCSNGPMWWSTAPTGALALLEALAASLSHHPARPCGGTEIEHLAPWARPGKRMRCRLRVLRVAGCGGSARSAGLAGEPIGRRRVGRRATPGGCGLRLGGAARRLLAPARPGPCQRRWRASPVPATS